MRIPAALALLSSLSAAPAAAQQAQSAFFWREGEWQVRENDGQQCMFTRIAPDGSSLMVRVSGRDDRFLIDVHNPQWTGLVVGAVYPVRYMLGLFPHFARAVVRGGSDVLITVRGARDQAQGFTTSPSMGVDIPGLARYGTPLRQLAMQQFTNCIAVIGGINQPH